MANLVIVCRDIEHSPQRTQPAVLAATASFTGLYIILEKLKAARSFRRIETLLIEVGPLQAGLIRSLRALGVVQKESSEEPDAEPHGRLADYLASKRPEGGDNGAC